MKKKQLTYSDNEYYAIDGFSVSQAIWYQVKISQQLDDIEEIIKEINSRLKGNEKENKRPHSNLVPKEMC
jgi:hypothetical protein